MKADGMPAGQQIDVSTVDSKSILDAIHSLSELIPDPTASAATDLTGVLNAVIILSSAILAITQYFYNNLNYKWEKARQPLENGELDRLIQEARKTNSGIKFVSDTIDQQDILVNQSPPEVGNVHFLLFSILVLAGFSEVINTASFVYFPFLFPISKGLALTLITTLTCIVAWSGINLRSAKKKLDIYTDKCEAFHDSSIKILSVHVETLKLKTTSTEQTENHKPIEQ